MFICFFVYLLCVVKKIPDGPGGVVTILTMIAL